MSLKLYAAPASGPCRMATMALELVGKKFDYKSIDLGKGEQHNPEYLKVIRILDP
jgi:glutathione S-transferase